MAKERRIGKKGHREKACGLETLEEAVQFLLTPHDLKGANPYLPKNSQNTFALADIVNALESHQELNKRSPRMRDDKVRDVLNAMLSVVRVGSTRKARYGYDSEIEEDLLGLRILDQMIGALLGMGGKAKWGPLQVELGVDTTKGITHLEFNSAVNYLVDNGVVIKEGRGPNTEDALEGERLSEDTREIICTSKAWGWDADGGFYQEGDVVTTAILGRGKKKSYDIALTERTVRMLDDLQESLPNLPENDILRLTEVDPSSIVEAALWRLWRDLHHKETEDDLSMRYARAKVEALSGEIARLSKWLGPSELHEEFGHLGDPLSALSDAGTDTVLE